MLASPQDDSIARELRRHQALADSKKWFRRVFVVLVLASLYYLSRIFFG